MRDILRDVLELRILGDTLLVIFQQFRIERLQIASFGVGRRINTVPRHRIVFKGFTGFRRINAARHQDIRGNPLTLGTAAVNAVELLYGVLHRPQRRPLRTQHLIVNAVQRAILLHGAFPEGRFTDDQRATIVLHCRGEDLRSRGAETVNQYHQRPLVIGHAVGVRVFTHFTVVVTYLHYRAARNEQTGQ
ncbi:hypothetical protein D3C78_1438030 [compost metagenome]